MRRRVWMMAGVFASVLIAGCSVVGIRSGTEQPVYEKIQDLGEGLELRRYGSRVFAEARVPLVDGSRNRAFRMLFNYIQGENTGTQEIAMTAPVASSPAPANIDMTAPVEAKASATEMVMRFFLPESFTLETAPRPTNPGITIGATEPRVEAVLRYSGTSARDVADQKKGELLGRLEAIGITPIGTPVAYFYDPPWTLPPLRRNEVSVIVQSP